MASHASTQCQSLAFVVNSMPCTDDQLNERILEAADRLRQTESSPGNGASVVHFPSPPASNTPMSLLLSSPSNEPASASARVAVSQCVISRNYIAVLFEDFRVCRFAYNIYPDRLNPSGSQAESGPSKKCAPTSLSSTSSSTQRNMQTARRRLIRSSARTRNTAIMGRNHLFSTPYVPEELVNQAQVVLQGKSRNVIIRELQRTNLDVNQAVNNLLSRDDEDFDDADDGPEQMIQSDDLMSLLDSGFHNDHSVIIDSDFSEEVFPYPLRIRGTAIFSGSGSGPASGSAGNNATSGGGSSSGSRQRPRDEVYSFLERDLHFASSSSSTKNRLYSLASAIDSKGDSPTASAGSSSRQKRSEPVKLAPISFTDQYEYWPSPPDLKFVAIATTFSELVALTSTGQVCQWRWQECEPFRAQQADGQVYFHPKVPSLGLLAEKVTHLSASCIRASVVTESGKVATWIDESVCSVASKLEHPAVTSAISESLAASCLKISALYVSSYMSCVQMSNGGLFWWGVPPFYHRKKLNEKAKNERSKSKCKSAGGSGKDSGEISQGSLVCMRNSPIYQSGALAFSTAGGIPKVGQLVNSAWKMTDSCSFRVLPNAECRREARPKETAECGKSESSRTEMPPPPSPASSTSSDAGYNPPLPKRSKTRSSSQPERGEQSMNSVERVETWNLKDVVFMEDVKSMPVGRVIKVDGNFVAVKFSHPGEDKVGQCQASKPNPQADSNFENYMQDCRLMRKDELVAIRACSGLASQPPSAGSKAYDFVQRVPKRVHIPEHVQILAMTVTNMGLHAIAKIGGYRLSLVLINIVTGRIEQDCKLSIEYSTFFGSGANPHCSMIKLFSAGESDSTTVVICRDANGTLYPLAKDCTETIIREPISLNLGPVATVSLGVFSLPHNLLNSSTCGAKTHAAILGLAVEQQLLMSVILRSDIDQLRERLSLLDRFPHIYHSMIGELCDGNHNIIHMAVSVCFPTSNKSTSADGLVHSVDDDETMSMFRTVSVSSDSAPAPADSNEASFQPHGLYDSSPCEPLLDPTEQKPLAHSVLWTLLDSPVLAPHLFALLSARDFQGLTPFMLAVSGRAYSAASQLFLVIQRVARSIAASNESCPVDSPAHQDLYNRTFTQMLYPSGSLPDHSPLYMLCSNDTCSFTWTGEDHINQDIFECRTCGLIGSLCCCTECARVCHRGHDCKLKRTSPTAYCDCWEKCKCRALIAGCQPARNSLLKRLLTCTDLVQRVNSRGEHILLFLVQTVGRQISEQKQFHPSRVRSFTSSVNSRGKTVDLSSSEDASNIPDHDLEPPKFSRRALEKLLGDWACVKSMILTGYRASENSSSKRRPYLCGFFNGTSNAYAYEEENAYLGRQNGSALLDKFTHSLLRIGLNDLVERLVATIVIACKSPSTAAEARVVARRFVRSVARVGLVVCFELNPTNYANLASPYCGAANVSQIDRILGLAGAFTSSSSSSKKNVPVSMLRKCRKIFLSFLPMAIEELCEIGESLIAPVKNGVARPSAPFVLSPSTNEVLASTDEIFSVDTQIYAHQRDFLDSTFGLDMLDDPPEQEAHPASEFSYDAPMPPAADLMSRGDSSMGQAQSSLDPSRADPIAEAMNVDSNSSVSQPASLPTLYELAQSDGSTINSAQSTASAVVSAEGPILPTQHTSGLHERPHPSSDYRPEHELMMGDMLVGGSEPDDNSNVGGRDTESDSESNPDDASYLSTADNASAQRSVVTGATAGSDVGVASLPYDDESINSNQDDVDEDDDEDGEGDDNDDDDEDDDEDASDTAETEPETEEISGLFDEQLVRRINSASAPTSSGTGGTPSSSSLPVHSSTSSTRHPIMHHVQWALRNHQYSLAATGTTSSSATQDSSFRRSNLSNVLVSSDNIVSMSNSAVGLARAFSIVVRQIADLMPLLHDSSELNFLDMLYLKFTANEAQFLQQHVEERLESTWAWLVRSMDSTESQLRFGCSLSNRRSSSTIAPTTSSPPSSIPNVALAPTSPATRYNRFRSFQNQDDMLLLPSLSRSNSALRRIASFGLNRPTSSAAAASSAPSTGIVGANTTSANSASAPVSQLDSSSARRDFLHYAMSLMRAHSNEHYDSLPVLDVASLKHMAYIFDCFVYYMRRGFPCQHSPPDQLALSTDHKTDSTEGEGRKSRFFRRSNSTLYLGCPPPDPFSAPFHEALPLASRPHLLQPNARREQLFGIPRPSNAAQAEEMIQSLPSQMSLIKRHSANKLASQPTAPTTPQRNQSVIAETSTGRNSIIQQAASITPTKQSVIVLAGSAKHQQSGQPGGDSQHSAASATSQPKSTASGAKCEQRPSFFGNQQQHDTLLGRWRLTLELFGRLFVEDVGLEPNSVMLELSGFPVKESKFKREMERLRNSNSSSQRDITFLKLDRDRNTLLQQTFKELNSVFSTQARRISAGQSAQHLAISRVKVTFKDEPGEGSGVARGFYTAFCEAVLAPEKLPPLDSLNTNNSASASVSSRTSLNAGSVNAPSSLETYQNYIYRIRSNSSYLPNAGPNRPSASAGPNAASVQSQIISLPSSDTSRPPRSPSRVRLFNHSRRSQIFDRAVSVRTSSATTSPTNASILPVRVQSASRSGGPSGNSALRYESPPFTPIARFSTSAILSSDSRVSLGNRIHHRVYSLQPSHASKITGMLLDLSSHDLVAILNSEEEFRSYVDQAMEIINLYELRQGSTSASSQPSASEAGADSAAPSPQAEPAVKENVLDASFKGSLFKSTDLCLGQELAEEEDNAPLFYQPATRGFYSPRAGRCSEARLNAFRNVGRIMGICFVQNELCPITLNRHVIKLILGKSVSWHDLAFFDSELYESLRQLILDAESNNNEELFSELDFAIDVSPEEGGQEVELIPNGRNTRVTPHNVYDYVRRYSLYRMVDSQRQAISAIRSGIFDVIPPRSFDGITAEDFRLLLNGVNDINVQLLQTYVTFHDESGNGSENLSYFRRWFWWVIERMSNEEKQDLIYFWTGSPALPASEEGFQPMPTITIRPPDDNFFVTANTCISRLYIPLYTSRNILRQKLLVSIKAKSFGFI